MPHANIRFSRIVQKVWISIWE